MAAESPQAALYIRLSKEDESEGPSQSVTNQLSLLNEYARQHGLTVYDAYIDDGWSGTNFDRPAFQRLLRDIEQKKVNMVVTKDLSRLGRDYIQTGYYMERYFPEHRVRYISLLDGIDTGVESSANDITPFRALLNDLYAKDISKKIKSVKRDKQRKGQFIGGKALYGYQLHPTEKNRIVVDDAAARVVRRMFRLALEGESCRGIAQRLNEERIPPPSVYAGLTLARKGAYSGLWSSERVCATLRNETYLGHMVQGRSARVSYKSSQCLRRERDEWIVVENTHEPLVSRETYETVQRLLESRRHTRSRSHDFPLKGLIVCHECGHPLSVLCRSDRQGAQRLFFICRTHQRFTQSSACSPHCVAERAVMDALTARLRELCADCLTQGALLPLAERALAQAQPEVEAAKARAHRLDAQLDQAYLDKLNGLLDADAYARIAQRLRQERGALHPPQPALSPTLAREWTERFLRDAPTSRALLCRLIDRAEWTEDRQLLLHLRFREPPRLP